VGLIAPTRLWKAPVHARIFVRHHGRTGPFRCAFCRRVVWLLDGTGRGVVHHRDHDHSNDAVENLAPAHRKCHGKHHHRNRQFTAEHRANISAALRAKGIRPPDRDWTGRGKGVPKSAAHRAAIAEAQRQRWARRKAAGL